MMKSWLHCAWTLFYRRLVMYEVINKFLLIYILSILCTPTYADETGSLYQVDVMVSGQSNKDKSLAFRDGLKKVFKRILVEPNGLANKTVQAAVNKASQFVIKYDFLTTVKNKDDMKTAIKLRVHFNDKSLLDFIRPSRLTIWDQARPETLLWLVVEEKGKKPTIYSNDIMPEIGLSFKKAAAEKALRILFPLLDLEDERIISINKIRKFDQFAMYQASERYMADTIIAGVLNEYTNCWRATWFFYVDDQSSQTKTNCSDLQSVVNVGVNMSFEKLALMNGEKLKSNQQHDITLKVSRVNGVEDMTRLINYLRSVPIVRQAEWLKVEDVYVFYALKYIGSPQDLDDMLALGRVVVPLVTNNPTSGQLEYRLLHKK